MEIFLNGLSVAAIGMIIVFFGLTILIGLIKLLTAITDPNRKKEKQTAEKDTAEETAVISEPVGEETEEDDGAIVAAITAALVSVLGSENGFTVRHIRRIAR